MYIILQLVEFFSFTAHYLNNIRYPKMKNSQDQLEILRKIKQKPKLSQRELAKELGFSLGKLIIVLRS